MFLFKILCRIYILSILPITVTSTNSSQTGFVALPISEDPVTKSDNIANPFIDLNNGSCNQNVKHRFKIPEHKPKKRKHDPAIACKRQSSATPTKRQKNIQDSFLGENTVGYLGEFRHELPSTFLSTDNYFDYEPYFNMLLSFDDSVFFEEFCSKEQLQNKNPNLYLRLDQMVGKNFDKLEVYTRRVVSKYVEIFENKNEDRSKLDSNSYKSINKALDPARTKGFTIF